MRVKYKSNFGELKNLSKALGEKLETRVGILAGNNAREEGVNTNAQIGSIHEFGSVTKNIPQRSWLRMPIQHEEKNIEEFVIDSSSKIEKALVKGNAEPFYVTLGIAAEAAIQTAFETGGWGQWAAKKIVRDGKGSPLIETSQLRDAVLSKVVKRSG